MATVPMTGYDYNNAYPTCTVFAEQFTTGATSTLSFATGSFTDNVDYTGPFSRFGFFAANNTMRVYDNSLQVGEIVLTSDGQYVIAAIGSNATANRTGAQSLYVTFTNTGNDTATSANDGALVTATDSGTITSSAGTVLDAVRGIRIEVTHSGNTTVSGGTSADKFVVAVQGTAAVTGTATGASARDVYGGWFSATGTTAGTTTTYGVYASASGGDTNWSGYFTGSVTLGLIGADALVVASNAPTFTNVTTGTPTAFLTRDSGAVMRSATTIPFAATFSAEVDFTAGIEVETIQNLAGNNAITIAAGASPTVTVTNALASKTHTVTTANFTAIIGDESAVAGLNLTSTTFTVLLADDTNSRAGYFESSGSGYYVSLLDDGSGFALIVSGAARLLNDLEVRGNTTLGNSGSADTATVNAQVILTPASAQAITAVGNSITISGPVIQLTANASYTLTSAPTIANGTDGQIIIIRNVDSGADVITIQDQGTLANSNLRLGATTRALGPRDSICLQYSSTVGDWCECWYSNVI